MTINTYKDGDRLILVFENADAKIEDLVSNLVSTAMGVTTNPPVPVEYVEPMLDKEPTYEEIVQNALAVEADSVISQEMMDDISSDISTKPVPSELEELRAKVVEAGLATKEEVSKINGKIRLRRMLSNGSY